MSALTELPPGYGVVCHPVLMYPVIYWLADEIEKVEKPYHAGGTIAMPTKTGRRVIEASRLGYFPTLLEIDEPLLSEIERDISKRGIQL